MAGLIGSQILNPFNEREYVTITGHDAVKNRVTIKDKRGKTGSIGSETIEGGEISAPSKKEVAGPVNINYYGNKPQAPTGLKSTPGVQAETSNPNRFDPGADLSMPTGEEFDTKPTGVDKMALDQEKRYEAYNQGKLAIAGASFFVDVMNANSAYSTVKDQAQLNIIQARNQAADVLYRGRQARLDRQSEGFNAGEEATLAMAAQGQDVQGAAVNKIRGSYEAVGEMNGAREEANAIREALGYELEEVNYKNQVRNARINRDYAVIGSALNFGANAYAYGT